MRAARADMVGGRGPVARANDRGRESAPRVLVILDGASEPLGAAPTSLERAVTPTLDTLAREGSLARVRTVAPRLEAGSESAIPALLGWVPPAPVDRGLVEAAAREIAVPRDGRAWRIDVRDADDGARADASVVRAALAAQLPRHALHVLGGHRLLAVGREALPSVETLAAGLAAWSLHALESAAPAGAAAASTRPARVTLHPWSEGIVPPPLLDAATVVVAAPGAAAGIARLMGARVVTPAGATGRPGSDLAAKRRAALVAIRAGAQQIVIHVGAPDEAAHERDAAAKIAAIEAADALLLAPLSEALRSVGGTLRVCPDHGCDPASGLHDADPVPCLTWSAGRPGSGQGRLTERAVAALPVTELVPRALVAA
ncbi:hypothetical protein [Conexibacter sp. CPCC 206217]|uniref:hypothetical protein n=1 Tax=Conexibacter sp. CPCC 206217 TaxID=3064574 RepID=UPI002723CBC6|nr:hypothetical protein [Conexibacter sp. CPCC 206217]MDO8213631.1 hypothetical protein [Conexibacter sp. CPCC 206217]